MTAASVATIIDAIAEAGEAVPSGSLTPVGGGCINEGAIVGEGARRYFVKLNGTGQRAMFEAEADGLKRLAAADAVRVPRPIAVGEGNGRAFLVLEFIEFGAASPAGFRRLGEALAQLHASHGERYGLPYDNTIGTTLQPNAEDTDWCRFFSRQRLAFQLRLAADNGIGKRVGETGERLLAALRERWAAYRPAPSLVHGDLWSGNVAFDRQGMPVLFDPACYYGDRETDLAMTELFGGFPRAFYDAYNAVAPVSADYPMHRDLYQLYHVLNHFNLFGGGYAGQVRRLLDRLLAELG
ncbi:hypothetical protein CAI21_00120 [Alkalilimnicola ehrlichii]|uniref:Fructosamine kinase n=1 Tax=Alkalilimnicola ehrlichii TaxID=351052 RepID=A0A3E0X1S0_9GAMM|nr:fructosamine kinase family protein [Alkalilimnicola ehrlichii]RFA31111.1 hypothetical protein CAI21_00120 [Alkalilimnicola ehrlichii]RFA39603.1 hypothetical protein CAL65_02285 [Alkalilimnicola ehrlichii]